MMQEGRDWDRLVVSRKDTTGEERVVGHTQIRKGGIAKVNLYTDFVVAALERVFEEHPGNWLDLLATGDAAMKDVLRHYYHVLRCVK